MIHHRIATIARLSLVAAAIGCGAFSNAQAATNLLTNGGFETGDLTGWTQAGDTAFTGAQCTGPGATVAEGNCSAFLGTLTAVGSLSQTFATTAGASYLLSFAGLFGGDTPSSFSATVNGTTLISLTNPLTTVYQTFIVPFKATGATSTLSFSFRDDPNFEFIDNVSVTAAVPEPATFALLFAGLGLVALKRRNAR